MVLYLFFFLVEEAVEKLLVLAPPENVVFKQPGPGGLTMKSVAQTINGGNFSFDHFLLTFNKALKRDLTISMLHEGESLQVILVLPRRSRNVL